MGHLLVTGRGGVLVGGGGGERSEGEIGGVRVMGLGRGDWPPNVNLTRTFLGVRCDVFGEGGIFVGARVEVLNGGGGGLLVETKGRVLSGGGGGLITEAGGGLCTGGGGGLIILAGGGGGGGLTVVSSG